MRDARRIRRFQDSYLFRAGWTSIGQMWMRCERCGKSCRFGREQDVHDKECKP